MLESTALSPGVASVLATIYEATAPKPGNVHPGACFRDLDHGDFVIAALATGPILGIATTIGVGQTVLRAVRATQCAVRTNTNLGTLLLVAPLATVSRETSLASGIRSVLKQLTAEDTRYVYEAIRLAGAGGLGRAEQADVHDPPPPLSLVEVMGFAADRDLVAKQYVNEFADVFRIAEWIKDAAGDMRLEDAIVLAHVRQLASDADSLIVRKCGATVAAEATRRAAAILAAGRPGDDNYVTALNDYDSWLRADGHRRNPGTTADLIAAALFVLLREGTLHYTQW